MTPYAQGHAACSKYAVPNPFMPGSFDSYEWDRGMSDALQAETDRLRDEPRDYTEEAR